MALAVVVVMFLGVLLNFAGARHDCVCYEFGTEQTAVGVSIYDGKSCQCKCKPHVEGKSCDRCASGFYGVKARHGCQPCLCDPSGSKNRRCDAATGHCTCREGFSGHRCNVCKPFRYRKSQRQCEKCNCNVFGSKDLQCDGLGRCPCHENVEGKHCDRCARFRYILTELCPQCPACYQKVNVSLGELQSDLRKTRTQIESIGSIDYEDAEQFVNKLDQIHTKAFTARDLMRNVKKPDGKLITDLKKKGMYFGEEAKAMLLRISDTVDLEKLIGTKIKAEEKNVGNIPDLIKSAEASLRHAAQNISEHDDAMENLARKSVKVHSNMATLFKKMLDAQIQLNDTCASACKTISEYERVEENFLQKLKELNVTAARKEKVNVLKQKISEIQNNIEECVTQNGKNVGQLDGLTFPGLTNYSGVKPDEERGRKLTAELGSHHQHLGLVSNVSDQVNAQLNTFKEKSRDSLKEIQEVDGRTDDFLEEINSLIEKYVNISGHNNILETSKAKMNVKLKDVPQIQDKINNLVNKMKAQNESLQELRFEINQSRGKLNDDLNAISDLQRVIDLTRANSSAEIEMNLSKLLTDMKMISPSDLTARLSDVRNRRKQAEEETEGLRKMEKKLIEMKEEMRRESKVAVDQMKKNIQALTDITEYLNALPTTDAEFALIEKELQTTEDILRLREEIEFLKKEVAHVKKIADSMPRGDYCPKRITLEEKNLH